MEIDRMTDAFLPTRDDKRLYGVPQDRVPFDEAEIFISRYPFIIRSLILARNFPCPTLGVVDRVVRHNRLSQEIDTVNSVMDVIEEHAAETFAKESVEKFLKSFETK